MLHAGSFTEPVGTLHPGVFLVGMLRRLCQDGGVGRVSGWGCFRDIRELVLVQIPRPESRSLGLRAENPLCNPELSLKPETEQWNRHRCQTDLGSDPNSISQPYWLSPQSLRTHGNEVGITIATAYLRVL